MNSSKLLVRLTDVGKTFRDRDVERRVLSGISLSIDAGETVAIMGANGVGKSTLAKIIAGVDEEYEGRIERSQAFGSQAPMIFQDYRASLLPWMSIESNIGFPLMIRGVAKAKRRPFVMAMLERSPARLQLNTPVSKLSGGQAQLVSVLRGFIASPPLLICDEPFSAIDYPARIMLRALIKETCRTQDIALLFVSHSIEDVAYLADRILILGGQPASVLEEIAISAAKTTDENWFDSAAGSEARQRVRTALNRIANK